MRFLVIFILLLSQGISAQKATKIGDLKGIDISFGYTLFNLSRNDATKIYSDLVLPDMKKSDARLGISNGQAANYSQSIYIGLASRNKWFTKSKLLKNCENRFGIWYGSHGRFGSVWSDLAPPNDSTWVSVDGIIRYKGYGVSTDFIIVSKSFFDDFAVYTGLGAAVSLHNHVTDNFYHINIQNLHDTTHSVTSITNDISMTSLDLKATLGIKYNFSCYFNLFVELSMGGSYYHRGLYGNNKFLYMGNATVLGVRYKFMNRGERSHLKSSGGVPSGLFW